MVKGYKQIKRMDLVKLLIYVYIGFFVLAGFNHFLNLQFYEPLVPKFIPFPQLAHQFIGILEIIIPLFLITKYRNEAALIMVLLLILIYSSNLYVWINDIPYGKNNFSNVQHFGRLLFQIFLILITIKIRK
jgi:uncharacterized membrane protein